LSRYVEIRRASHAKKKRAARRRGTRDKGREVATGDPRDTGMAMVPRSAVEL
jgi:hypothetical protein